MSKSLGHELCLDFYDVLQTAPFAYKIVVYTFFCAGIIHYTHKLLHTRSHMLFTQRHKLFICTGFYTFFVTNWFTHKTFRMQVPFTIKKSPTPKNSYTQILARAISV